MSVYDKYEIVVGLEVHVQLNTKSKAFCSDSAAFGGLPNTHISPISLAHPGTLPRMNKAQIESAVKLGLALGCQISPVSYFDRKNYFYADLPKGYQISQDGQPICIGGQVEIRTDEGIKAIRLHHIHMEEDAGKLVHDLDPDFSLVDLNRAGVPLLEIVSEPDMRSAEEAYAYISELRKLVRYLGISDGNMEEGSIRCDCNVSVRLKGVQQLGNRCEVKNVNSIRNAKRAIEFEVIRQIDLIEAGESILQETRSFDAEKGITFGLRSKENAPDYRYFPDPDLPPVVISETLVRQLKTEMPTLPNEYVKQFVEQYDLSTYDALILTEDKLIIDYFLTTIKHTSNHKAVANWLINTVRAYLKEDNLDFDAFPITPQFLAEFIQLIDEGKVNTLTAKQQLFPALLEQPDTPPALLAKQLNLIQDADDDFVLGILEKAIEQYPDKFEALKKGKKKFMGLFVGEVMRAAKGKADPKLINELIQQKMKE